MYQFIQKINQLSVGFRLDSTFDIKKIYEQYNYYYENEINQERVVHNDVKKIIDKYQSSDLFRMEKIGESIEKREIYSIAVGNGNRNILVWSQMHGDEPTATAALFDLLKFFCGHDQYDNLRKEFLSKLTIHIIPMLNPDGAEQHKRENKISIDVNRDSQRRVTPEAKILWDAANKIKPEFAFNLHDQNSYYTSGRTGNSSAISMLAPPFNYDNSISIARRKSMQLIASMNNSLTNFIPNRVARYKDDHEPRSFGDTFVGNNISSILIESGFIIGDDKKSKIRKLNFIALLSGFHSILTNNFENWNEPDYYSIPENQTMLFDLLLKNLTYKSEGQEFKIDIGINREKKFCAELNKFYYKGKIAEVGDLNKYSGINEFDLSGYDVRPARVFEKEFNDMPDIDEIKSIIENGNSTIKLNPFSINFTFVEKPINVLPSHTKFEQSISVDDFANLTIYQENKLRYIVINGFICPLENYSNSILNGVVIS